MKFLHACDEQKAMIMFLCFRMKFNTFSEDTVFPYVSTGCKNNSKTWQNKKGPTFLQC